jgi:zinc protease
VRNSAIYPLLFTLTAAAQSPQAPARGPQPVKKEAFKNVAPVSKEVLKVKLPRAKEVHLENGMTVLILEDHRLPQVSIALQIEGGGGGLDPTGSKGLSSLSATLMREGTATMNSKQIAEQVDLVAANIGAGAANTALFANFNMSGLSDNFDKWFPLGMDIFLHPSFPADEWAKLKQRTLLQLRQQRTNPGFLATERFQKLIFGENKLVNGDHPYATSSATAAEVEAMTPEVMKKWHDERLAPQNTIMGVVGDITEADILPKLKTAFGAWKKTDYKPPVPANAPPNPDPHVVIVNRPGSVQTNLVLGNVGIDRRNPDYYAMVVMNQVLGGGGNARLFLNLREDKGYTYGAYSNFAAARLAGAWQASSQVRTDVTEGAMREFFNELKRIREEKVPATELEEHKRGVVASFALSLESPATLLSYAIQSKTYGFPDDYWENYPSKISAVTADDVQRVAQKYLTLDNIQIVAVGDVGKIKPVMEKYGKVAVYDTDGKLAQ